MIGISGSLNWSKILIELIFNFYGEFRWSPEGLVSQIHSPHLHAGAPGVFSDLLRSVEMLKREWGAERNGKLLHLSIPSKTAALIPEFAVEDLPLAELHPWFLRLQWRTCPWAEHTWWWWWCSGDPTPHCYFIVFQFSLNLWMLSHLFKKYRKVTHYWVSLLTSHGKLSRARNFKHYKVQLRHS